MRPDYYQIGQMVNEDEEEDEKMGALINTPSSILAEMDEVKGMVNALHTAITNALSASEKNVRPEFMQAWLSFKAEWEKFYDGNSSWSSRLWGAALEKTLDYKERVYKWQDAFKKEGVKLEGPAFEKPGSLPWKWLIAGGAALVGLVAIAVTVKEVGSTVRSFKSAPEEE